MKSKVAHSESHHRQGRSVVGQLSEDPGYISEVYLDLNAIPESIRLDFRVKRLIDDGCR